MDNFIFSVNVTIPIFLVILLGYILRRIGFLTEGFVETANKYVFSVALPVMLFKDIATSEILNDMDIKFVIYCMSVTIAMFILVWIFAAITLKDKTMVGAYAQGAARGSAAILGVTFVENICGNAGMAPLMIVSAVPFFNVLSVIILTFSANKGQDDFSEKGKRIKKACINILKNPIIIGIFVGIPFAILNIDIPEIPMRTINYVAQTATPIALIAIGGGFDGKQALTRLKLALSASFIKLVALPAVFLPLACYLEFKPSEIVAILIMLASPTTVSSYIMAKNMKNDGVLASNIVVITTLVSSVTLTAWIFILRTLGYI